MDWGIPPGGIASSVELETAVPALVSSEVDTTSAATTVSLKRSARRVGYCGVSVIIVNYYQWANTRQLLRQLQDCSAWSRGRIRVVVVDNGGSGTGWTDTVGGIRVRYESRNLGFAGGVNRGVRELDRWRWGIWRTDGAVYEWFLLLNPDVTVPAGFLDAVMDIVEQLTVEEPRAGVVGLRLCNPDGSLQGSCGRFPTLGSTLRGLLRPRAWRKCLMLNTQQRQQVDWVTGGCLLVRRDCFEQLGGLDESFFLYYEDVDFCHRAKAAGWQVLYEPRIIVTHHWPLHARVVPAPLRLITRHALMQFARKHWGRWSNWCLHRLVWFEALYRAGWAYLCRRHRDSACYQQLRYLVRDISQGRLPSIPQRLAFASRYLRKIAAAQGLVPDRSE
jgi:N-acetylglucosaminyl-diphospho-decaprenol L-rhamnosyltransferase